MKKANRPSRFTTEYVKMFVENKGFELLNEYANCKEKLILKDSYGYMYSITFDNLHRGKIPPMVTPNNPYVIQNIKLWLSLNNSKYELVSSVYLDAHSELIIKDNDGYFYNTSWTILQIGHSPFFISISNRFSSDNIKRWCQVKAKLFELVGGEYVNEHELLQWRCLEKDCKEIFKMTWNNVSSGHGYPRCALKGRQREGHHNWKGGITPINKIIRESPKYKQWRIEVFERDNYTCQCCGNNKSGNLESHHIFNFSKNKHLRFDVNNGITLCKKCHNPNQLGSFHNVYGSRNNTKEQLDKYIGSYKLVEVIKN